MILEIQCISFCLLIEGLKNEIITETSGKEKTYQNSICVRKNTVKEQSSSKPLCAGNNIEQRSQITYCF